MNYNRNTPQPEKFNQHIATDSDVPRVVFVVHPRSTGQERCYE